MAHPKADIVRRMVEGVAKRDFENAVSNLAEDVVYHVSGHGPLGGEYRGRQEVMGLAKKQQELTGGTFDITEIHDVVAGDDHAVALLKIRAQRNEQVLDWGRVVVFHIGDDKITEAWIVDGDQQDLDRFLS